MGASPSRFNTLIESVADGDPLDWDALDAAAEGSRQRLLRHLRLVARVAEVHRSAVGVASSELSTEVTHAAIEAAPWGPFVLLSRVGEGAFGEVYRARDPWLDRDVALKLLKPGITGRVSPNRIVSEARILARLRHPNVVTIHGADVHDGRAGLWMEMVRGRTLSQILAAEGPFSASEASVIGQEVCRALSAVHAAGVVHQDVKAQNVMRESGGRLVLMDFGAGSTPLYLAPEVLKGSRASVASDVYAVGVLLFHLVTARYPVAGASLRDLERAHGQGQRLRLADARADLPDAFVAAVERALDPDAARRFASAGEMRTALSDLADRVDNRSSRQGQERRRFFSGAIALSTTLVLSAALLVAGVIWRRPDGLPVSSRRSVAVLPFRAIGSDPETVVYSEGLSEDLRSQLASLAAVQVVSTRRGPDAALTAGVGRELDVDALVSGSVRLSGATIRVAVELVDARRSQQIWARLFERPRDDIVRVQSEVVEQVARALKGALTEEDASRLRRHITEPRAFELYLKGRYYWNTRTPDGLRRSVTHFNEAIAVDPDSALPYAGLADAHMLLAFYYLERPAEAHALAEAAALEALRLDPNLAQVHASLGSLRLTQFRWAEAEASLKRAIELNPSYAPAHQWYGLWLTQQRRFDEALTSMQSAREADPFSYVLRSATAYVYYAARDHDSAVREYRQVLDVDPAFFPSHVGLIETLAARGSYQEALDALAVAQRRTGRAADLSLPAAYVYARAGRRDDALSMLQQIEARVDETATSRADIGSVYASLGDKTRAFEWLARAVEDGDTQLGYLGVDPRFDALRGDPRFAALMASLGIGNR
jgi:serine/threonine protein kinase/tetratricopeptide (TPR) repeat protein